MTAAGFHPLQDAGKYTNYCPSETQNISKIINKINLYSPCHNNVMVGHLLSRPSIAFLQYKYHYIIQSATNTKAV